MERRTHHRLPIRLNADIHDKSNRSWSFIIENFGLDGLFLKWPNQSAIPDSIKVNDRLDAHFQIEIEKQTRAHNLELKVVRILDQALAVSLYNPALDAMSELSRMQQQAGLTSTSVTNHLDIKSRNILDAVNQSFLNNLAYSTDLFLPTVHDSLFQQAETSKNNSEQALFFDAINTLNKTKDNLKSQFIELINIELNSFCQDSHKQLLGEEDNDDSVDLDLIDQNEFEKWLAVNQLIIKISPHYEQELLEIKLRLTNLCGINVEKVDSIPFSPDTIFKCFSESIHQYFLNNDILLVLYRQFEKVIDSHLCEIYKTINQIFIDNNILPIIEKKKYQVIKEPELSIAPAVEQSPKNHAQTGIAPELDNRPVPDGAEDFSPVDSLNRVDSRAQHMTEINTIKNNVDLSPTFQTLKELLSFQGGSEFNEISEEFLASDEYKQQSNSLIKELSNLQKQILTAIDKEKSYSGDLSDKLIDCVKKNKYAPQLYNEFKYSRDITRKLFDSIKKDQWLGDPVKKLLSLLQIPLLKVAFLHKDFFESWSNPARIVFNKLAMIDFDDEKNKFYIKARSLVLYLLKNYDQDLNVFEKAQRVLSQLIELQSNHYNKCINRIIKKWDAQQIVTNELASRLSGHSIPIVIADFISYQWLPVLVSTYLEKGNESSQWSQYLQALDMLILSMTGDVSDEFIDRDVILFVIKQGLDDNNLSNKKVIDDIESFLRQGAKGHKIVLSMDVIIKLLINGYALSDKTALAKISKGLTDASSLANKAIALRLQENDFVVFNQNKKSSRLQFIWGSDNQNVFVFAGRAGQQAAVFNLMEVISMFENGQLSQTKDYDLPILERSLYAILGDVHDDIAYESRLDPITGFIDRKEFERLFAQQLKLEQEQGPECALCLINIDRFSLINETCGYEAGDRYLSEISQVISQNMPNDAVIARFGIDEFAIILPNHGEDEALNVADTQRQLVNSFIFRWQDKEFTLSASIGMVIVPEYNEAGLYLKAVVTAATIAQELGRNRVHLLEYDALELNHRQEIQIWATKIDQMIKNSQLDMRGQRLQPLLDESLKPHYEMLLLIKGEDGKMTPPAEFIEAAELYNKMADVDRWVIEYVLAWYSENPDLLEKTGGIAINLSGQSLNDVDFLTFIQDIFKQYPVPPELICFEITETVAVTNMNHAINIVHAIKEIGCEFSLDDFGTGQSSYAYLKNLPVNYLKIDGVFIKDMVNNPTDQAMVKSINEIGHFLGMKTVAEYVENDEIIELLLEIGVDYAQGFGVEKPTLMKQGFHNLNTL